MVHTYKRLGKYMLIDSDSGSVFEVDRLTHLLIRDMLAEGGQAEYAYAADDREFLAATPAEEIAEAQHEIRTLIEAGALFTEEPEGVKIQVAGVKALCLNVSHSCNLACRYCFAAEGTYNGPRANMDEGTAYAAVDFLARESGDRHTLEIDFFGGEPLLNLPVVKSTVDYARKKYPSKDFKFTMTTNGVLLSKEIAHYLNDTMQNVVISIDGRYEVNNSVRVSGADFYDRIVANALYFRSIRGDADYYIRGTYTAENLDFTADAEAILDLGFDALSLEPVVLPVSHPLAIPYERAEKIGDEYENLARLYQRRAGEGKPFTFFHFRIDPSGGPCERKRLTACGAGCEYFCATPSGKLYPCHQFAGNENYCAGDVHTGVDRERMREFAELTLYKKADCKKCFAKFYCSGGCSANAVNLSGSLTTPDKLSCAIMRARIEVALALSQNN